MCYCSIMALHMQINLKVQLTNWNSTCVQSSIEKKRMHSSLWYSKATIACYYAHIWYTILAAILLSWCFSAVVVHNHEKYKDVSAIKEEIKTFTNLKIRVAPIIGSAIGRGWLLAVYYSW